MGYAHLYMVTNNNIPLTENLHVIHFVTQLVLTATVCMKIPVVLCSWNQSPYPMVMACLVNNVREGFVTRNSRLFTCVWMLCLSSAATCLKDLSFVVEFSRTTIAKGTIHRTHSARSVQPWPVGDRHQCKHPSQNCMLKTLGHAKLSKWQMANGKWQ